MDAFLLILMSAALAGMIVFFVFAFVKGKDYRSRNFLKAGGCLYALLVLAAIFGSEDGALLTFLGILMVTALFGMVAFFILAFVKGKGNRLHNFLKSGGCFVALLLFAIIVGTISEDDTGTDEAKANASVEEQEAEATAKQKEEDQEREAREQAEKEKEEQEAKEQAQKDEEEREAQEQAQKEQEEREAKEQAQKEQEAKEAEEQKKKEEEERKAEEEAERKAKEEAERKAEEDSVTGSQKQAVAMAEHYINFMAFSKSGLIDQLEFEGFSTEDATYGTENISVDWQEQAVIKAEEYLDFMAFSRQGLIDQLIFEGFSKEHAAYAASQVGL